MSISKKLKAYVRFDGSGRVVAGSLILRKAAPKVGRWQEIVANECCAPNSAPPVFPGPIVVGTVTATSIDITWTDATDGANPVTGYNIMLDGVMVGFVGQGIQAYTYTGLTTATSYDLAVVATDGTNTTSSATVTQVTI
jgi:hypothetical protein